MHSCFQLVKRKNLSSENTDQTVYRYIVSNKINKIQRNKNMTYTPHIMVYKSMVKGEPHIMVYRAKVKGENKTELFGFKNKQ